MGDYKATDSTLNLFFDPHSSLQLSWILGCNAILAISAAYPLSHTTTPISLSLTVCCLISISMIAARYIDILDCSDKTVDGEPTGLGHRKQYAMIMLRVSVLQPIGVWVKKS